LQGFCNFFDQAVKRGIQPRECLKSAKLENANLYYFRNLLGRFDA
jgi:hypothetical protein